MRDMVPNHRTIMTVAVRLPCIIAILTARIAIVSFTPAIRRTS